MPFWDECLAVETESRDVTIGNIPVIPSVLTSPKFRLGNNEIDNPLYSYTLAKSLSDQADPDTPYNNYTKPAGYKTVRYPLSGLVGDEDIVQTQDHNRNYPNSATNAGLLHQNVKRWLDGNYPITPDPVDNNTKTSYPPTSSVLNQAGQNNQDFYDSLENPHNAIHLAVGGFYEPGNYDANNILGANGDMGENNTAGFDPIFFFHHCWIDHVFWLWQQKHGQTEELALKEDFNDPGLISDRVAGVAQGEVLSLDTRLWPFEYNTREVIDIRDLGYTYGPSSLTPYSLPPEADGSLRIPAINDNLHGLLKLSGVTKNTIPGSFAIDTWAVKGTGTGANHVLLHTEPVLSRFGIQGCKNCQNHLDRKAFAPVQKDALAGNPDDWTYYAVVRDRNNINIARVNLDLHKRGGEGINRIVRIKRH